MEHAFLQCESHPGRPLAAHLQDVAERISWLAPDCQWLRWAALFHDIGKATSFFQKYLYGEQVSRPLRRHADLSALWLLELLLPTSGDSPTLSIVDAALAFLFVRRHHGHLVDLVDTLEDMQQEDAKQFTTQLAGMDCAGAAQWLSAELKTTVTVPVLGRKRTKLRIGVILELKKPASHNHAMKRFQAALMSFGKLIEADRDSAAGYEIGAFDSLPRFTSQHIAQMRQSLVAASPSPVPIAKAREQVYQAAISNATARPINRGGLWSLTVPTGAGKTLAALGWALHRRDARVRSGMPSRPIIYALPFTSVIDQNAEVIRQLLPSSSNDESLLAIHHHLAELGDIARSGEESLARIWVEGWRADIVSTTFVQVSNALFHGTCADARRFAKLFGSILILDEVQSIPAELWPVFRTSLQSLCENYGTDILLVTATQPALFTDSERTEIAPSGLQHAANTAFNRYDLFAWIAKPLGPEDLVQLIVGEMRQATSCLIILNTIGEALDLHRRVKEDATLSGHRLFHLSTNLRPKDRNRILKEIRESSGPHILVATQVVEAGFDLTFDVVVRAIAPLDSIVQAAGRCNRHGSGVRGRVIIIAPEGNSAMLIYGSLHIALSRQMLQEVALLPGNRIAEPALTDKVTAYFTKLNERIQKDTAVKIHEAIQQLQFAALRGEGQDKDRHEKRVRLIDDQQNRVSHFIETDESDASVWRRFTEALGIEAIWQRRRQLRLLRNDLGQRIVEVPQQWVGPDAADSTVVRIPVSVAGQVYDVETGWKRTQ